ncbi:acireductone dioxygenase-like [Haemaphysalis longicornis]
MRAWYLERPNETLSAEQLDQCLGVKTYRARSSEDGLARLASLKEEKCCQGEDMLFINPCNSEHQNMLTKFWREHRHPDEEIRYFEEGVGYFDVRDNSDAWVRVELEPLDLFILPPNTYHRFQPRTPEEIVTLRRIFVDETKWTAEYR